MSPEQIVEVLLNGDVTVYRLPRPPCTSRPAVPNGLLCFLAFNPVRQEWRSTGLTDQEAALALAAVGKSKPANNAAH